MNANMTKNAQMEAIAKKLYKFQEIGSISTIALETIIRKIDAIETDYLTYKVYGSNVCFYYTYWNCNHLCHDMFRMIVKNRA